MMSALQQALYKVHECMYGYVRPTSGVPLYNCIKLFLKTLKILLILCISKFRLGSCLSNFHVRTTRVHKGSLLIAEMRILGYVGDLERHCFKQY